MILLCADKWSGSVNSFSKDVYSYGLALMDCFFTKEELAKSFCFKSKKSEKPPLNHAKMEKLLGKHVLLLLFCCCNYLW